MLKAAISEEIQFLFMISVQSGLKGEITQVEEPSYSFIHLINSSSASGTQVIQRRNPLSQGYRGRLPEGGGSCVG